jgi:transcriptional regulator with XRE-family HTH domain
MQEHTRIAVRRRVGSNIRRLRKQHNLTQDRLAERAGHQGRHVGQIERSEANVGLDVIADLANGLEVDAQDLFAPIASDRPGRRPRFTSVPSQDLEVLRPALDVVLRAAFRSRR